MKDDPLIMGIAGVTVTDPVRGSKMQLHGAFQQVITDGYSRVFEIGPLVGIGIAGIVNNNRLPAFSLQTPVIEITKSPDKMQQNFAYSVIPHDPTPPDGKVEENPGKPGWNSRNAD